MKDFGISGFRPGVVIVSKNLAAAATGSRGVEMRRLAREPVRSALEPFQGVELCPGGRFAQTKGVTPERRTCTVVEGYQNCAMKGRLGHTTDLG